MSRDEASREWASGWPVVVAGVFGISFVAIPTASLGLFMAPLEQAFGWTRTQISLSGAIAALTSMIALPFVGMLVDKGHSRLVALTGLAGSTALFALLGLNSGSLVLWSLQWLAFSIFLSGVGSTIIPADCVSDHIKAGRLVAIPIQDPDLSAALLHIIVRIGRRLPSNALAFLEILERKLIS